MSVAKSCLRAKFAYLSSVFLVSTVLTACGGGGGSNASVPTDPGDTDTTTPPANENTTQPPAAGNDNPDDATNTLLPTDPIDGSVSAPPTDGDAVNTPLPANPGDSNAGAPPSGGTVQPQPPAPINPAPPATEPPETSISGAPATLTNDASALFEFASSQPNSAFEASVDGGVFGNVTNPLTLTNLPDGQHSLTVRAINDEGTPDPSPATYTWTIDTQSPETSITSAPPNTTTATEATFEFGADEPSATFEVSIDGGPFQASTSPVVLTALSVTPHTFAVRAVDSATNTDASPATHTWEVTPGDNVAPQAVVTFPTPLSLTNEPDILITGTASDSTGVAAVRVNGRNATSNDGFASWQATVPLQPGANEITVETEDTLGNINASATSLSVKRSPNLLADPDRIAVDDTNSRAFIVDGPSILTLDINTGAKEVLASSSIGSGPDLQNPRGMVFDAANNRILVIDQGLNALLAIDPDSKVRAVISDSTITSTVDFGNPRGLTVNDAGTTAYVADSNLRGVITVNLSSGVREAIASQNVGTGTNLVIPVDVAYDGTDAANPRLLVTDILLPDQVIAIDLTTLTRQVFSGGTSGSGIDLLNATRIFVDSGRNRALVADDDLDAIVAINLTSGARSVLSDSSDAGPDLVDPRGLALAGNSILVAVNGLKSVYRVNSNNGTRTRLTDDGVGSGDTLGFVQDLALDANNNTLFVTQNDPFAIVPINLQNSSRGARLDNSTGSGPQIAKAQRIALDANANRFVLLAEEVNAPAAQGVSVFAIENRFGDRHRIYASFANLGANYFNPSNSALILGPGANNAHIFVPYENASGTTSLDTAVVVDLSSVDTAAEVSGASNNGPVLSFDGSFGADLYRNNNWLLVSDFNNGNLLEVRLSNGNRRTVSNRSPNGSRPDALAYDPLNNRAIVSDSALDTVWAVNLNSGRWTAISNPSSGDGPSLTAMHGLQVEPQTGVIYIYESNFGAIMAIEPNSGERVVVSR